VEAVSAPFRDDPVLEARLAEELDLERMRREVRRRVDAEERPGGDQPFDAGTLAEVLARPPEPPYRVEALIPSQAGTLVVAQRKTGKTTWALNLARSLILGAPFLGRFETRPLTGRAAFLNFEVSAAQVARWAHEHDVPDDRLYLVNLRGRRNPLGDEQDRARLAEQLRAQEVETLIVDPFGRAYTGASQNDAGEVGAWLTQLDAFARGEVGAVDLVLTAHAGWEGTRSRGSSALEDWADTIVTLTADAERRTYMRATGRDVDVEEDRLAFDPDTRTLRLTGYGSAQAVARVEKWAQLEPAVVAVVQASPGVGVAEVIRTLRDTSTLTFQDADVRAALKSAADRLLISARPQGVGRKIEHYPVQPRPTPSTAGVPTTPSTPVYKDGVGVGRGQVVNGNGRGGLTEEQRTIIERMTKTDEERAS
jgi:hypothetical protein